MNLTTLLIILTPLLAILWHYAKTLLEAKKDSGRLYLKALISHENRGLRFTRGREYTFWKQGDRLICNEDDITRERDNYPFYKDDLDNNFEGTDLYSRIVLDNTRYYHR